MIDGKTQERLFARLHAAMIAFGKANGVAVEVVPAGDSISWWSDKVVADVCIRMKLGEPVSREVGTT